MDHNMKQQDYLIGCVESPEDSRDYIADNLVSANTTGEYPRQFLLETTPNKSQGATLHCTAYGITNVHEIMNTIEHGRLIELDPEEQWVNQLVYPGTANEAIGDYTRSACDALLKYGLTHEGRSYRITGYAKINNTEEDFKKYISSGFPIYTSCDTTMPMEDGKESWTTWSYARKTGFIKLDGKKIGGHAHCAIGYDEEGVIFKNSYGEKWGFYEDGTFKAKWEDLEYLHTAWISFDEKDIKAEKKDIILAIRQCKILWHMADRITQKADSLEKSMNIVKEEAHKAKEYLVKLL